MREKIINIVSRVFETEVNENTDQKNCAAWDSLRHLNLIIELEDEFNISFEPEEIAQLKSIALIEQLISQKLK